MANALAYIGDSLVYAGDSVLVLAIADEAQGALSLSVVDDKDATGATATVGGTATTATNTVSYRSVYTSEWTEAGSREGDGTVAVNCGVGEFFVKVSNSHGGDCAEEIAYVITSRDTDASRKRLRDNAASAVLRIAKLRPALATYYATQDATGVTVYTIPEQLSHRIGLSSGETDIYSIDVTIPRQTGFPPNDGFAPGALLKVRDNTYRVDSVEGDLEEFSDSATFRLSCGRYGYTVEMGSHGTQI